MNWGEFCYVLVAKGANGCRYYVQQCHGRGWHAAEKNERHVITAAATFIGPGSCDKARQWCERRGKLKGAETPQGETR